MKRRCCRGSLSALSQPQLNARLASAVEQRQSVADVRDLVAAGADPFLAAGSRGALAIDAIRNYPAYIPVLYVPDESDSTLQTHPWHYADKHPPRYNEALARLAGIISTKWDAGASKSSTAQHYAGRVVDCISRMTCATWPENVPAIVDLFEIDSSLPPNRAILRRIHHPKYPCVIPLVVSAGAIRLSRSSGDTIARVVRLFADRYTKTPDAVKADAAAGIFDADPCVFSSVLCCLCTGTTRPVDPETVRVFVELGVDLLRPDIMTAGHVPVLFRIARVNPRALPALFAAGVDPNTPHPKNNLSLVVDAMLCRDTHATLEILLEAGARVVAPAMWLDTQRSAVYRDFMGSFLFRERAVKVGILRAMLEPGRPAHYAENARFVQAWLDAHKPRIIKPRDTQLPSLLECAARALGRQA